MSLFYYQGFSEANLVFDCTLSNFAASSRTLDVFLAHKWRIDVVHVYRPYKAAVKSVLERGQKEGRYVGLGPGRSMSTISCAAQDVFSQLYAKYKGRVNFFVFRAPSKTGQIELLAPEVLAPGGTHKHGAPETLMAAE